ncbi:hypothetical protein EIP86_006748, partial [Pleurotus ostreatoroseus]
MPRSQAQKHRAASHRASARRRKSRSVTPWPWPDGTVVADDAVLDYAADGSVQDGSVQDAPVQDVPVQDAPVAAANSPPSVHNDHTALDLDNVENDPHPILSPEELAGEHHQMVSREYVFECGGIPAGIWHHLDDMPPPRKYSDELKTICDMDMDERRPPKPDRCRALDCGRPVKLFIGRKPGICALFCVICSDNHLEVLPQRSPASYGLLDWANGQRALDTHDDAVRHLRMKGGVPGPVVSPEARKWLAQNNIPIIDPK